MKKLLFMIFLTFAIPVCLKAQGTTLGKTRNEIRQIITSNPSFKLSKGDASDTLAFQQEMRSVFYYKNDTCYSSKSIMPLAYKDMVVKKMTDDSYKKVKDNVWINPSGVLTVEITVLKDKGLVAVETRFVDKAKN